MNKPHQEGPPPIFGTWNRFYAAVAGFLVSIIALFTWFTLAWNR